MPCCQALAPLPDPHACPAGRPQPVAPLLPRMQALDRGAALVRADKIATGHNADDVAETVLLNIIRGDVPRWVPF